MSVEAAIATRQEPERRPRTRWPAWLSSFNLPGAVVVGLLVIGWQAIAGVLPAFLFPPIQDILRAERELLGEPAFYATILHTYARIIGSVGLSFALAVAAGIGAASSRLVDRSAAPLLALMQGVPAICWIIFAILWFRDIEIRIVFIVVISTAPNFFLQSRDAVLAISKDLRDMVLSWRPTKRQVLTKLILPSLVPILLTTILVNLGIATKVGVTAELLAGVGGIGGELRTAEEQFRMEMALAWTLPLVAFIFITGSLTRLAEKRLLRWRPPMERPNE